MCRDLRRDGRYSLHTEIWPDYDTLTLFELSVASCLLTLTQPGAGFPEGPTIWKAPAHHD